MSGTISVEPGVERLPVGRNNDGTFVFTNIALVCAGLHEQSDPLVVEPEMTGTGLTTASGAFGVNTCGGIDFPLVGSFCATFALGGTPISPGCTGTLGGDEMANLYPVNVLANDWSVTTNGSWTGGVNCSSMGVTGQIQIHRTGVISLGIVPNPQSLDGHLDGSDLYPGECSQPPPEQNDPNIAATWFCEVIATGVAVLVSSGATFP